MLTVDAPAKVNLALHVTGRRADGYHLIESLVGFAEFGDRLSAGVANADGFVLDGPEAGSLSREPQGGNLVIRARDALREMAAASGHACAPVSIRLDKRLPVASGLGGGSADAAATLKLLCQVWNYQPDPDQLSALALRLGADVPMCLYGRPLLARGIGEILEPADLGFALDLVIANPRIAVSTPEVFSALERRDNASLPPPGGLDDRRKLMEWLRRTRNDLEPPARRMVGDISRCLAALADAGADFVRMSGSGASCYGLFADRQAARDAEVQLRLANPGWFIAATRMKASH